MTEFIDYAADISAAASFAADMSVKAMLPLVGNLAPSIVLALTTLTTTPSIDLPLAGMTLTFTLGPSPLAITPAVTFGISDLSVNVFLSGDLENYDDTSFVIVECGTF